MGDVLGRGLQVGEMYKMAERLDAALNIERGVYQRGRGDHVKLEVVNCDVSLCILRFTKYVE